MDFGIGKTAQRQDRVDQEAAHARKTCESRSKQLTRRRHRSEANEPANYRSDSRPAAHVANEALQSVKTQNPKQAHKKRSNFATVKVKEISTYKAGIESAIMAQQAKKNPSRLCWNELSWSVAVKSVKGSVMLAASADPNIIKNQNCQTQQCSAASNASHAYLLRASPKEVRTTTRRLSRHRIRNRW